MSPPLAWSGAPDGTASFVLIVHDVDAAIGNGTDDMLHWMVWNIPGVGDVAARSTCREAAAPRRHATDQRDAVRTIVARRRPDAGPHTLRVRAVRARYDARRRRAPGRTSPPARAPRSSPRWPDTSAERRRSSGRSSARRPDLRAGEGQAVILSAAKDLAIRHMSS